MGQRPDDLTPRSASDDVWGPDPVLDESRVAPSPPPRITSYTPELRDRIVASTADSPKNPPREDANPDVAELREEIEQTRSEMSGTIDAIQERLSPQQLADEAKGAAANLAEEAKEAAREAASTLAEEMKEAATSLLRDAQEALREATIGRAERMVNEFEDTARGTSTTVMDTIRQNPLPSAMIGIGLGWLFLNRRKSMPASGYTSRPSYRSTYPLGGSAAVASPYTDERSGGGLGETVGAAQERAGELAGQAKDTAGEVVGQVRDAAGNLVNNAGELVSDASGRAVNLASSAGSTARGAGSSLWENIQQNPVPAALAGVSVAWLVRSWDRGNTSYGSYSGATDVTYAYPRGHEDGEEGPTRVVGQALTKVDHLGREMPDRAGGLVKDKPLVMGALALGLGAAAGLAVPNTEAEGQLMGGARDQIFQQTASAMQGAREQVQRVAEDAKQAIHEESSPENPQGQSQS